MKRYAIVISFFALLVSASSVKALMPPSDEFPTNRAVKRVAVASTSPIASFRPKEEVREKITAVRRERIRSYFSKMLVRLEATIERLNKLVTRIDTRITKIDESDSKYDLTKAKEDIQKAKELLATTNTEVKGLEAKIEVMITTSTDPKLAFEDVREAVKLIKDNLKEVHSLLVHSIGELKGLRVGPKATGN